MKTLEQLSMANAVSGNEMYLIPKLFGEVCKKYRSTPFIDALGNVILYRKGNSSEKTVALISHTDEAGFIVRDITDSGFLKFEAVGEIDPRVIISKKVLVGENKVKGIIGMKAIHLQKKEEREEVVAVKNLFIDIGAKDKKAALKLVSIGDYISFATDFSLMGKDIIKGKALDRMGAACLISLVEKQPKYDTYYIFSAQKHIGSRGALVALERINPDFAYVIDAVETADLYKAKGHETTAKLHSGAVISSMDIRSIGDSELIASIRDIAKAKNIPVQDANTVHAESETGAIRSAYTGTKAALIGIPCRYTNTPVSLMSLKDFEAVSNLMEELIVNKEN